MNLPQLFGKNVRLRRNELGLSQERLAELCQFHRTYIGLVERGGEIFH
jgi:transcriptional regulator with XRE-family HTH domain